MGMCVFGYLKYNSITESIINVFFVLGIKSM